MKKLKNYYLKHFEFNILNNVGKVSVNILNILSIISFITIIIANFY